MGLLLSQSGLDWAMILVAFFGAYLSGSVPFGLLITRIAGMDYIRKSGSGNIGATNVFRLGGKRLGAITLVLDALKGTIPVLVARQFHMDYALLAALGAVLGHIFPIWLRFKGGKGVATSLGVLIALNFILGLGLVGIWIMTAALSRMSSLAALTAFGFSPVLSFLLTKSPQVAAVALIIAVIVFIRHHENIRRLINDTESKINFGSTTKDG